MRLNEALIITAIIKRFHTKDDFVILFLLQKSRCKIFASFILAICDEHI